MEDYPRDLLEFESRFATEQACRDYLFALRWPNGSVGSLEVVNAPKLQIATRHYAQDDRVEVTGSRGVAWVNRGHGRLTEEAPLRIYRDGKVTDHVDLATGWEVSFVLATRDFIEAIRAGRGTLLSAAEHRDVLSTALAAQASAREGRAVQPSEVGWRWPRPGTVKAARAPQWVPRRERPAKFRRSLNERHQHRVPAGSDRTGW